MGVGCVLASLQATGWPRWKAPSLILAVTLVAVGVTILVWPTKDDAGEIAARLHTETKGRHEWSHVQPDEGGRTIRVVTVEDRREADAGVASAEGSALDATVVITPGKGPWWRIWRRAKMKP